MGLRNDRKGQGSVEYLLLFGAIIVIAIAGLYVYYSYFTPGEATSVSIVINNPNKNAVDVMYEVRDTQVPSRVNKSSAPTKYYVPDGKEADTWTRLAPGETRTIPVPGSWRYQDSFYIEIAVRTAHSVNVEVKIGDKIDRFTARGPWKYSSNINGYLKSGSIIKYYTIQQKSATDLRSDEDIESTRKNVSNK